MNKNYKLIVKHKYKKKHLDKGITNKEDKILRTIYKYINNIPKTADNNITDNNITNKNRIGDIKVLLLYHRHYKDLNYKTLNMYIYYNIFFLFLYYSSYN